MATGFVEKMEAQAREFIKELICEKELSGKLYGGDLNFKPWYSPRGLIDDVVVRVDRVLIGINPGGCPSKPDHTTEERRWEDALDPSRPFNAYLDESWGDCHPGASPLQRSVQKVFKTLYGDQWEPMLRRTVCLNVCPIRTSKAEDIPVLAWKHSIGWTKAVLNELMPSTIICIGNVDSGRSAWAMLKSEYKPRRICREKIGDSKISLKSGEAGVKPFERTRMLALPHLTGRAPYSRDALFKLLSERSDWINGVVKE